MKKINYLAILVLLFLLFGCRTESLADSNQSDDPEHKFQLTSQKISLNDSKHRVKLIPELKKAQNNFNVNNKIEGKGKEVDYGNGVSINTDDVIYIENGPNYHTYTFNIIRENAPEIAPLENLVLTPLPDGSYKEYLVTYDLTIAEKESIANGDIVTINNRAVITPLEGNPFSSGIFSREQCQASIFDYYTWCSEGKHNNGETCQAAVFSQHIYVIDVNCSGGGAPGGTDTSGGNTLGNGGASGGNCVGNGAYLEPQDPVSSGCPGGVPTQPNAEKSFFAIVINLPAELKELLNANLDFKNGLEAYYNANNKSIEAENFVKWAVVFKSNNTSVSWTLFENWFLTDIPDGFFQQIVLENPMLVLNYESLSSPKFKMRRLDQIKYPKFTQMVKGLKGYVQGNPLLLSKLVEISGMSQNQVLDKLTFGQGPQIELIPGLKYKNQAILGLFTSLTPEILHIKEDLALGLEHASLQLTIEATNFLLAVTVLHEFVHYGNYLTGFDPEGNESGELFENSVYGMVITRSNAGQYILQFKNK